MFRKVLMPVDAFSEDPTLIPERVTEVLRLLLAEKGAEVEAAYVMTPKGVHVPLKEYPEWEDFYERAASNLLVQVVNRLRDKATVQTKVLSRGVRSIRTAVKALLDHATNEKTDLIAITTHARKGVDRYFQGSFTETLLLQSEIPVLSINPKTQWDPSFRRLLYPVDLSDAPADAARKTASIAQRIGAEVILYHLDEPAFSLLPPPGFVAKPVAEERTRLKQQRMAELRNELKAYGVIVREEWEVGTSNNPAEAIANAAARLSVSLIVTDTRATKASPFTIGGTTRQLIRRAGPPILAFPVRSEF